jgi:hypothetical protein
MPEGVVMDPVADAGRAAGWLEDPAGEVRGVEPLAFADVKIRSSAPACASLRSVQSSCARWRESRTLRFLASLRLRLVSVWEAWAISSGRLHNWPERYEATDAPLNMRLGFAVLWAGAISSALVTVTFVFIAVNRPRAATAMILFVFASGYLWWRWPRRPPQWMKRVARGARGSAAPW